MFKGFHSVSSDNISVFYVEACDCYIVLSTAIVQPRRFTGIVDPQWVLSLDLFKLKC